MRQVRKEFEQVHQLISVDIANHSWSARIRRRSDGTLRRWRGDRLWWSGLRQRVPMRRTRHAALWRYPAVFFHHHAALDRVYTRFARPETLFARRAREGGVCHHVARRRARGAARRARPAAGSLPPRAAQSAQHARVPARRARQARERGRHERARLERERPNAAPSGARPAARRRRPAGARQLPRQLVSRPSLVAQ